MPRAPFRSQRRVLAGLAGAGTLGLTALMFSVVPAAAAPPGDVPLSSLPGELVVNGGAETGNTSGWTGSMYSRPFSAGGYPDPVILPLPGTPIPNAGTKFFSGAGGSSQAYQDIDLSPAAAAISNGVVTADLSAYLGGFSDQQDRGEVTYKFLDAANQEVQSVVLAAATPVDRNSESGFLHRSNSITLNPAVRSVRVTFAALRFIAPANDGYVDNISLQLFGPAPTVVDDTPTTVQDQPVTFDPTANDTPSTSSTIDPTTVRLIDGGSPVTTLTNADGTYTVDTTTGKITFTPTTGFTGTATSIDYQVTDTNGLTGNGSITVTVGPVVGIAMFNAPAVTVVLGGLLVAAGATVFLRRRRTS